MKAAPLSSTDETSIAKFIGERGPDCLIIARHGETEWNVEGRLQGQHDTSLNQRGHSQALLLARFLREIPLARIHCSPLRRCRETASPIAEDNVARPVITYSDLLKETALGVLEGELKNRQTTAKLTQHYQNFSSDEINYRIPGGETLHDVFSRVQRFFADQSQLLTGNGVHLVIAHRNLNKMILKALLGLSFEEGFRVEHEHQRLYFYFSSSQELWSCEAARLKTCFTQGYTTTDDNCYA
jgi:broad specificity phosphatase PhoE